MLNDIKIISSISHEKKVNKGHILHENIYFVIILKLLSHELSAWNPRQWKTLFHNNVIDDDFHSKAVKSFHEIRIFNAPNPLLPILFLYHWNKFVNWKETFTKVCISNFLIITKVCYIRNINFENFVLLLQILCILD